MNAASAASLSLAAPLSMAACSPVASLGEPDWDAPDACAAMAGSAGLKIGDVDARGGLDLADVTAAATTVCSDGLGIQGRRRHVVVFNRNTKAARYDLQICIETRDGDRQHLDPRIRNGGRAD